MDNISDRLDFLDKSMDLYNDYIDNQKRCIINEIKWLEENVGKPHELRSFFFRFLHTERVLQFSEKALQELAEIRGNHLYSQLQGLEKQKINNRPLKIIVQELKFFGK